MKEKSDFEVKQISDRMYNSAMALVFKRFALTYGCFFTHDEYIKAERFITPIKNARNALKS